MTVHCNICGQEWPRDPALEVECPDCRVSVGSPCRRPSGHACNVHAARDRLPMDRGFLTRCPAIGQRYPALAQSEGMRAQQLALFDQHYGAFP
jgi:hypothetical protein